MKRKLVSALLCTTMVLGSLALVGCGGSDDDATVSDDKGTTTNNDSGTSNNDSANDNSNADSNTDSGDDGSSDDSGDNGDSGDGGESESTEAVASFSDTFGDSNGTHLDLWTFVDAHAAFYGTMAEEWNAANSDKTIELTAISYPYSDMHNKLLMSFQAGTGAPDICDVEVGQFPNVVAGEETWLYPLDDAMAEYKDVMVQSRIDTYAGADGKHYGAPFHVGATVMYYNLETLEQYGITQKDIDKVVTWDDFEELGKKYVEARNEEGKYWTQVDTGGTDWMWIAMAEYGEDWTGGFDGSANVQLESVKNMLTYQKRWLDEGIAEISPDGQIDLEAGFQNIMDNNVVAFPKAMWFMSRFMNYMSEKSGVDTPQDGKWYIAKCPVFKEGQICSVGIGGTGTVVTQQSPNKELAAEWICWAKMSEAGEKHIWEDLGFDVCNSSLWTNADFADNEKNPYNTYFRNKPYDVLADIGLNNIGKISVVKISPTINDQMNLTTFNDIFENGVDIDEALEAAQEAIELEE